MPLVPSDAPFEGPVLWPRHLCLAPLTLQNFEIEDRGIAMLRNRFSRNALLAVFIGAFAVLGAQNASAEGDRYVFLRFAGDFIQYLEQTDVVAGVPTGTSTLGLIRAKVRGNLGPADLTAVGKSGPPNSVSVGTCPDGFIKVADIVRNNLVFTFYDLSLLYGDGKGFVCINFMTGEQYSTVAGEWLGGTGRFRNVSGEFSISFDDFVELDQFSESSVNTQVIVETGTITGTLSHDD